MAIPQDSSAVKPTRRLWTSAFTRFYRARIDTRYLEPIRSIRKHEQQLGEGFAVVALFCTLIEYLESCERGDNFRFVRQGAPPPSANEYNQYQAAEYFKAFLRTRQPFSTLVPSALVDS